MKEIGTIPTILSSNFEMLSFLSLLYGREERRMMKKIEKIRKVNRF
jgi:hypothetical protein